MLTAPTLRPLADYQHGKVWIFIGSAYSALTLEQAEVLQAKLAAAIAKAREAA